MSFLEEDEFLKNKRERMKGGSCEHTLLRRLGFPLSLSYIWEHNGVS